MVALRRLCRLCWLKGEDVRRETATSTTDGSRPRSVQAVCFSVSSWACKKRQPPDGLVFTGFSENGEGILVYAFFVIVLIFLAPISAIAAAIYEIVTGKQEPTLYLLLAIIPGAMAGALKELKDSSLLPPNHLVFKVDANHTNIKRWARKYGEAIQQVASIIIPIRIEK